MNTLTFPTREAEPLTLSFDGPFDVLLGAIREEQVDIFAVSLTELTSAYFDYFKKLDKIELNLCAEFLVFAACLLEIKSRKVLPAPPEILLPEEEEEGEAALGAHLEEYRRFKLAAQELKLRKESFGKIYSRYHREMQIEENREIFLMDVSLTDLVKAFQGAWNKFSSEEEVRVIKEEELTLTIRISEILKMFEGAECEVGFESLFIRRTRIEVVLTFLAVLELAKRRFIYILQGEKFGGIYLKLR